MGYGEFRTGHNREDIEGREIAKIQALRGIERTLEQILKALTVSASKPTTNPQVVKWAKPTKEGVGPRYRGEKPTRPLLWYHDEDHWLQEEE